MKLTNHLILFTVFLTPLLGAYKGYGYESIKVIFFIIMISFVTVIWLVNRGNLGRLGGLGIAGGLFILTLSVTSILGINPQTSFLGRDPYFQGVILYAYFYLLFLTVSFTKIKVTTWSYILVGSAAIVSLLAIKDWVLLSFFNHTVPTYAGRVVSTFGQPNFYSGFILLVLPFWYLIIQRSANFYWYLVGLILTFGIIISESRIAIILSLALLLGLFIKTLIKSRWLFFVVITFALLMGVAFGLFSQQLWSKEFKEINSQNWLKYNSPEKRFFSCPF